MSTRKDNSDRSADKSRKKPAASARSRSAAKSATPGDPPPPTLEKARAAKTKARSEFEKIGHVSGIGLTRQDGQYAVKVNLEKALPDDISCPTQIDGVPIVVHVVGRVKKQ